MKRKGRGGPRKGRSTRVGGVCGRNIAERGGRPWMALQARIWIFNEIELFVERWMDLESVIQSDVSQKEKNKYRMLMHIYRI